MAAGPPAATIEGVASKVQVGLVAANLLFWVPILGWTVLADHPYDPPAHIDDPSFAEAAEAICAEAQADVVALGSPIAVDTPDERAQLVFDGNEILQAMLADVDALPRPTGPDEAGWVTEWLADWDVHLADRRSWAEALQAGNDGPFVETAKEGFQISRAIDEFAEVNRMEDCKTSGDV